MNLGQMRTAVRYMVGLSANDSVAPNEVVNEFINQANQSISTERDWPWLYQEATGTTTAESADLTLPTGLTRVIFLTVQGTDMASRGMRDLAAFRTDADGEVNFGAPTAYSFAGAVLKLSPVPEAGTAYPYVLGFIGVEPTLEQDDDTPLLPLPFHNWIVTRAALLLAIRANNKDRIPVLQDEDVEWEKRVTDNVRRASGPPFIRRTRDSVWQAV